MEEMQGTQVKGWGCRDRDEGIGIQGCRNGDSRMGMQGFRDAG